MRVRPNIWMMIAKTAAVNGVIQTHMDEDTANHGDDVNVAVQMKVRNSF